ncbi:TonB family C-terminal domain-containing protein [Sphingomonas guangdongensis]|uniref:TonB family C-terminal domain-containing protein n=1 Tax=Sphingomonas guangdongensis TaxID=1141890 RepID=A0A285QYT2_9SPHN|nr:energy transducer TonB [Sphingomonas guangdongensis]SOB86991.1 TonB family C-terminal domain-containing protein [Sphingomonas guangdongensis]
MSLGLMVLLLQQTNLSFGPVPTDLNREWLTQADYPADALKERREGPVEFELTVDPTGKPVLCRTLQSSGTASLDRTTCAAIYARVRFKPTLDDDGKPVFASITRTVKWVHPSRYHLAKKAGVPTEPVADLTVTVNRLPIPADKARVGIRVVLSDRGTQESCTVALPSARPALDKLACTNAASIPPEPIFDAAGAPVRGVRWRRIHFVAQ